MEGALRTIKLLNASIPLSRETQSVFSPGAWERQAGESMKAYNAFRIYCELGRDRSLAGVTAALAAQKMGKKPSPGGDTSVSPKQKKAKSGRRKIARGKRCIRYSGKSTGKI